MLSLAITETLPQTTGLFLYFTEPLSVPREPQPMLASRKHRTVIEARRVRIREVIAWSPDNRARNGCRIELRLANQARPTPMRQDQLVSGYGEADRSVRDDLTTVDAGHQGQDGGAGRVGEVPHGAVAQQPVPAVDMH